jgi:hypothetical protein
VLEPAPARFPLPVFKLPPLDQVPVAASFIVSLKVFVVELKYNCPSVIFLSVVGVNDVVHSSVKAL